jgi:hypothetical protein
MTEFTIYNELEAKEMTGKENYITLYAKNKNNIPSDFPFTVLPKTMFGTNQFSIGDEFDVYYHDKESKTGFKIGEVYMRSEEEVWEVTHIPGKRIDTSHIKLVKTE